MLISEIGAIGLESVTFSRPDRINNVRIYLVRTYAKAEGSAPYDSNKSELVSIRGQSRAKALEHMEEIVSRIQQNNLSVVQLPEAQSRRATRKEQEIYLNNLTTANSTYRSPLARGRPARMANPRRVI